MELIYDPKQSQNRDSVRKSYNQGTSIMGACLRAAGRPSGTRALSSWLKKSIASASNVLANVFTWPMVFVAKYWSMCFLCSLLEAFFNRTGTVRTCRFPSTEFDRRGNKLKVVSIENLHG